MTWMSLTMPFGLSSVARSQELQTALAAAHLAAPHTEGIAMLATRPDRNTETYYFSPAAVRLMRSVLVAAGAADSGQPPAGVEIALEYGERPSSGTYTDLE